MTVFALFLGEKAERYIELRQSLGYSFSKQAGTLRAFVRYVDLGAQSIPQVQGDSASADPQRVRVGVAHRRMRPHFARHPAQGAHDGDADRIVGKLGTAIGRSGQA